MDRKKFIRAVLPLTAAVTTLGQTQAAGKLEWVPVENGARQPAFLREGDIVGITCPAGFVTPEEIQPAVRKLEEWGFRVKIGSTVGKRDFTFGGTDEERLDGLQQMLDSTEIKAILSARGGYGLVRIIDRLNFDVFKQHPKWVLGFSDLTVFHSHIHSRLQIASIHSKMCNSFPDNPADADLTQLQSIDSIRQCLIGNKMEYAVPPNIRNRKGHATGQLVGGNLKLLESMAGTNSDIDTRNKILFIEDTGEYLYSIDRMCWNLERSGKLKHLAGLVVGGFRVKPDDAGEEFGKPLEEIILEKVMKYDYPVCFDFPVGHQKHNLALKCGVSHRLTVDDSHVTLKES